MKWMTPRVQKTLSAVVAAAGVLACTAGGALAADPREDLRAAFDKAVKGKKVAWVPVWVGVLESEWTRNMKTHFDDYGMEFAMRDPNMKSDVQLQAVSDFINEKPDVLIVQNPNVTLLVREFRRAMDAGIYVIQVNMASNQLTDAYVGVDARDMGRRLARDIVAECGGGKGSGQIAILEGEATAAYSLDMKRGAMEIFDADKSIKVVSSQPANWDANKAGEVTTTVLQQNPELCAIMSVWGPQAGGAAQAVKTAGMQDKTKIWVASDGQPADCDMLEQGLFYKLLSYRADTQGEAIVAAALQLIQNGDKPGSKRVALYTTPYWVKSKADRQYCFAIPQDAEK